MNIENLRDIVKKSHLTQTEIAKELGIAKSTLSGYLYGNHEPDIDTLIKLSKILNVDIKIVLGLENKVAELSEDEFKEIKYHQDQIQKILERHFKSANLSVEKKN